MLSDNKDLDLPESVVGTSAKKVVMATCFIHL
jgi:hypothetical protein